MSFGSLDIGARSIGLALAMRVSTGGTQMFREGGIKAEAVGVSTRPSSELGRSSFLDPTSLPESRLSASVTAPFPASIRVSPVTLFLLVAETAAFALAAASGKIPSFLFTAIRALLTF